jgi:hypothetical protein
MKSMNDMKLSEGNTLAKIATNSKEWELGTLNLFTRESDSSTV